MSTHSPAYLRRRTVVRAIFWTPITLLGFAMIVQGYAGYLVG
ncbi:hypothetical protein [Microbacterium sp.]|nr:hypothetical protein [Microbacterium sp.]